MRRKIDSLQFLRAYAAIIVSFCHLYNDGWLPRVFNSNGETGVDVFFVLSGFIMAYTFNPKTELSKFENGISFIWKRIKRIYPIYLICAIPLIIYVSWVSGVKDLYYYYVNLFLLPSTASLTNSLALPVSWTLAYEMFFYIVFTFFIFFSYNKKNVLYGIMIFLVLLLGIVTLFDLQGERTPWSNMGYMIGDYRLLNFVLGILIYFIFEKYGNTVNFSLTKALIVVIAINVVQISFFNMNIPVEYFVSITSSILVLSFVFVKKISDNRLNKTAIYIGDASYSIYLTHFYFAFFKPKFYVFFGYFIKDQDIMLNVQGICLMIASILFGCLFYEFIERLINKYLNNKRKKLVNTVVN